MCKQGRTKDNWINCSKLSTAMELSTLGCLSTHNNTPPKPGSRCKILRLKTNKYHTIGTIPKSKPSKEEIAKPLTHIYMTAHIPGLDIHFNNNTMG